MRVLPNKNNRIVSNDYELTIQAESKLRRFFRSHFPTIYDCFERLKNQKCSGMDQHIMDQLFSIIITKKIESYEQLEHGKLMEKLQQIESSLKKYVMIKNGRKYKQNKKKVA